MCVCENSVGHAHTHTHLQTAARANLTLSFTEGGKNTETAHFRIKALVKDEFTASAEQLEVVWPKQMLTHTTTREFSFI